MIEDQEEEDAVEVEEIDSMNRKDLAVEAEESTPGGKTTEIDQRTKIKNGPIMQRKQANNRLTRILTRKIFK